MENFMDQDKDRDLIFVLYYSEDIVEYGDFRH